MGDSVVAFFPILSGIIVTLDDFDGFCPPNFGTLYTAWLSRVLYLTSGGTVAFRRMRSFMETQEVSMSYDHGIAAQQCTND